MAIEVTARGKVTVDEKGRYLLHIDNQDWYAGELARFGPDVPVVVTVKKWYKKRSLNQNSMLHWYLNEIAEETGMRPDEIKEVMRHLFLSVDLIDRNGNIVADKESGEVIKAFRSTTELNTFEFTEFVEKIRVWANDFLNLQLPTPGDETEIKF